MNAGGHRDRVAAGAAWSLVSWVVALVAGPVVAVLVVHSISHRQYGSFSEATSLVAILAGLTSLGLSTAVIQVAVTERSRRGDAGEAGAINSAVRIAAVTTLAGVVVSAMGAVLLYSVPSLRPSASPFIALIPIVLLAPFAGVVSAVARILYRPRHVATAAIAAPISGAAIMFAIIVSGHANDVTIAAATSAAAVIGFVTLAATLRRWYRGIDRTVRLDGGSARLLAFGIPALVGHGFVLTTSELTVLLLGSSHGSRIAGLYTPAAAMALTVVAIPAATSSFYLPAATDLAAHRDLAGLAGLYHWITRWNITLASPAIAVLLVAPKAILTVVFGPAFASMCGVLRLLMVGVTVQVASGYNGLTLDAFGLPKVVAARQGTALALSVVACVVLIPTFGAAGAAIACSFALVAANILTSAVLALRFRIWPWDRATGGTFAVLAAAMAISAGMIATIHSTFWQCVVVAATSGTATGVAALIFGGRAERSAIANRLRRRLSRNGLVPGTVEEGR
ncbi:MAG: oligosaccharide flippase family protein [Actinomycetota bacterium]|nr:oligosaccharide flippase family protein [Actinomycetota bacterium]